MAAYNIVIYISGRVLSQQRLYIKPGEHERVLRYATEYVNIYSIVQDETARPCYVCVTSVYMCGVCVYVYMCTTRVRDVKKSRWGYSCVVTMPDDDILHIMQTEYPNIGAIRSLRLASTRF